MAEAVQSVQKEGGARFLFCASFSSDFSVVFLVVFAVVFVVFNPFAPSMCAITEQPTMLMSGCWRKSRKI